MIKRIGFACKYIDYPEQVNGINAKDDCKRLNTGSTTVAWLNRQSREVAEQRLWDLMEQNIAACQALVERVGQLPLERRMVRLSSDILPVFTEPTWRGFWQQADVRHRAEWLFRQVGDAARMLNVRLSFHPGQFCVLASESDDIVERSIEEFEYHATMAAWMGYGRQFQDYKINVHISGRRGPAGIRAVLGRLSPEARNCLTIENEEITHGLTDCLQLGDVVPIVLDIHHHWIREGEYIQRGDDRIKRVIDSWRGRRPVCHYSVSREDILVGHDADTLPDHAALLAAGYKRQKLRAHSDFCWNRAVNEWALTHNDWADIMVEAKSKNLASEQLYQQLKSST
jgi:UV DNA damage repair endonuclease